MLSILDLNDIQMSGEAKSKRLFEEIEERFEMPLQRAQLATLATTVLQGRGDIEGVSEVKRILGGSDGENTVR